MTNTARVLEPGLQTTVQDLGGRRGMWDVGVPPSGAWDDLSFALANLSVGNSSSAAGLESVMRGPVLCFERRAMICLTGAAQSATLNGRPVRPGIATVVPAGGVLDVGPCGPVGLRSYLAVAGGIAVEPDLGSRATFVLGGFGGLHGRALAVGDELPVGRSENLADPLDVASLLPSLTDDWTLRVLVGPHGAPDFLTGAGARQLFTTTWRVDHRADRTGIRLIGPAPSWARADGGEAGLHPSNIHDSAYPVGGIMLSGDTPVIVGPDGPSLGGFVVPCVVATAEQWRLGQLRPGDRVRLQPITVAAAAALAAERLELLADVRRHVPVDAPAKVRGASGRTESAGPAVVCAEPVDLDEVDSGGFRLLPPLAAVAATRHHPAFTIRRSGDAHLLVEAGPAELDLSVRLWIHLLARGVRQSGMSGIRELVEGVRSLLIGIDIAAVSPERVAEHVVAAAAGTADPASIVLDVREVTLPIAFDHPLAHEAMARYTRSVRADAPWCPDNVEFIRRINDLPARADVFDIMTEATYLVVGLGDVYLGAPVAVPIDPRHRLVTTKYDPARTWTPQNAVGIGGVYLCVYGMEGPGGYQLTGRTVPVWRHRPGSGERPWLLNLFDRIRFAPVTAEELDRHRAAIASGAADLQAVPATFALSEIMEIEMNHRKQIEDFRARRSAAFAAERSRWGAR